MTNSEIFKKAHQAARAIKSIVGDYVVAFSLSLKKIYEEIKSMKILNIKFNGEGSEKQIEWATSIFNAEIKKISEKYETAKVRVSDGSMPKSWIESWVSVLNNVKAIAAVERFANQSASETISFKGLKSKSGASVASIFESLATKEYNTK